MRYHGGRTAENLTNGIRDFIARIEVSGVADAEVAATIRTAFADEDFSLSDLTSWAVMERFGVHDAIFREPGTFVSTDSGLPAVPRSPSTVIQGPATALGENVRH